MITINEFMTSEVCTLRASDSINDAWRIMTEKHIRHIPITDEKNHLLGLVTQRDVLASTDPAALQDDKAALIEGSSDVTLGDIMIRDVSTIHTSDSLRQAAVYLQSHKYGCLPVVVDDCLVGIITDSDFISIAINLLEQAEFSEEDIDTDYDAEDSIDDIDLPELNEV